jgi:thymidylate synthase (FAD)
MKFVEQSFEFDDGIINPVEIYRKLERAGRTCYKSEWRISLEEGTAEKFLASIIKRGHESVLEHVAITLRIITDRGVTHELVRHRIASYSQESTRYCNYANDGELSFIRPVDLALCDMDTEVGVEWQAAMYGAERSYLAMIELGCTPEFARSVLPNSLKTEIVVTMNLREWRHFFNLRCSKKAHPQMRTLALSILKEFTSKLPVIFDDISNMFFEEGL